MKRDIFGCEILKGLPPVVFDPVESCVGYKKYLLNVAKELNEIVTVQEAAEITNSNVRQVQRNCEKGKYKCRKAKGTWLILRSSL